MNSKNLAGYGAIAMSLLTALAGAPYALGDVATIIPPAWKAKLFIASAIAAVILKAIRDQQTETKPPTPNEDSCPPPTTRYPDMHG